MAPGSGTPEPVPQLPDLFPLPPPPPPYGPSPGIKPVFAGQEVVLCAWPFAGTSWALRPEACSANAPGPHLDPQLLPLLVSEDFLPAELFVSLCFPAPKRALPPPPLGPSLDTHVSLKISLYSYLGVFCDGAKVPTWVS